MINLLTKNSSRIPWGRRQLRDMARREISNPASHISSTNTRPTPRRLSHGLLLPGRTSTHGGQNDGHTTNRCLLPNQRHLHQRIRRGTHFPQSGQNNSRDVEAPSFLRRRIQGRFWKCYLWNWYLALEQFKDYRGGCRDLPACFWSESTFSYFLSVERFSVDLLLRWWALGGLGGKHWDWLIGTSSNWSLWCLFWLCEFDELRAWRSYGRVRVYHYQLFFIVFFWGCGCVKRKKEGRGQGFFDSVAGCT